MGRRRGKRKSPGNDHGSKIPSGRKMAPQAAAHRRGGTHKVRDEDRTDSVYDTYNYKELLDAAKERRLYRKDMKKVEMAWALKRDDEEKSRAERDHLNALRRKQEEAKREQERIAAEKQALINAKQKKKLEKKRKRERDESVSNDTLSDAEIEAERITRDEYKREAIGQALSDSSWDSSSSESQAESVNYAAPSSKLRILEWPYESMPSTASSPPSFHTQTRPLPYVPLKVITTYIKQKFFLPGHKYPPAIPPDYVPILSPSVRAAAHKGHLSGPLRKASIETGVYWSSRTLIQPSTAHMYFLPCAANTSKRLADVYEKWSLESSRARRVKGGGEARARDRDIRVRQRKRIKTGLVAEIYEVCKWRPVAMGYIPAFLDFDGDGYDERAVGERTLENLRYVRFPGCDVPHYYFWVRQAEGGVEGTDMPLETEAYVEIGAEETAHVGYVAGKHPRKTARNSITYQKDISEPCTDEESQESDTSTHTEALYRRPSITLTFNHDEYIINWLDQISPSFGNPPASPLVFPWSPPTTNALYDDEDNTNWLFWKQASITPTSQDTSDECPFCCLPWNTMTSYDQTLHMVSHYVTTKPENGNVSDTTSGRSWDKTGFLEEFKRQVRRRMARLRVKTLGSSLGVQDGKDEIPLDTGLAKRKKRKASWGAQGEYVGRMSARLKRYRSLK